MVNYFEYFKTVMRHKFYVGKMLLRCGLVKQAISHDMSKLMPKEFVRNARRYNNSEAISDKVEYEYAKAWCNHKAVNKHHWEYWTDFKKDGLKMIAYDMPNKYVAEMICDWVGAGMAYEKGSWKYSDLLQWYLSNYAGIHVSNFTRTKINQLFYSCSNLDELIKYVKRMANTSDSAKDIFSVICTIDKDQTLPITATTKLAIVKAIEKYVEGKEK